MGQMRASGAAVIRVLPGGNEFEVEQAYGRWAGTVGTRTPLGEGATGQVIRTGTVFAAEDVRQAPAFLYKDQFAEAHAAVALPLVAEQYTLGALWVLRPEPFTAGETQLLRALADLAANALHRASLHEATQQRAEQLAAINALGRKLSETLDLPRIYAELCATGAQLLPDVNRIGVRLYDSETELATPVYTLVDGQARDVGEEPPSALKPVGKGTQSEVIRSGRPLIIGNLPAHWAAQGLQAPPAGATGMQSGLYVPMLVKGRVIGVLHSQSATPDRYGAADAEVLGLAANAAAIAIENARLFAETERRLHYVQAMHDIDRAITSSLDVRVTLTVLLDHATTQLEVDAAAVLLLNPHLQVLDHAASRGFRTKAIERSHVRLGEGVAGRAALERRPILITDLAEHLPSFSRQNLLTGEGFVSYYTVPLIAKGEVKGVLDVFDRAPLRPTHEWLEFVQTLAGQAAVAIENAGLFNTLQRANLGLGLAYEETIEGWARALDVRERGEAGHARRTTELAERVARALGIAEADLVQLRRGGLLHDAGLVGVPDVILNKPGPLSEAEWAVMRQHPALARELLSPMAHLRLAQEVAYSHHEHWDGMGYPAGLKGEAIPRLARVFAAADAWDALTSRRPWREAWEAGRVKAHLKAEAGKQFDPQVVEALVRLKEEG
jgi:HD-GYP domain-containing protein (c-di-GMP phosphodiesterase class II)